MANSMFSCPTCGGAMWDETTGKFWNNGISPNGKQKPIAKCKNKECAGAVWADRLPTTTTIPVNAPTPASGFTPVARTEATPQQRAEAILQQFDGDAPWQALHDRYDTCATIAQEVWAAHGGVSHDALIAATATLFIEANKRNLPAGVPA